MKAERAYSQIIQKNTLLISDSDMLSQALKYAPGQNKKPISLLWDLTHVVP
jgi:hypothetical protein